MPAFLLSCRANADIEWILYTDIEVTTDVPPNVTFKPTTVIDLNRRCSERLATQL